MHMHSFAEGRTMALGDAAIIPARRLTQPYDQTNRFNRIVHQKDNDLTSTIYSIDANEFLKVLENDQLGDLFRLTLACRPTRDGVGMWDVLFNNSRQAITACIMAAQKDFTPIPQSRVVISSQFLNFSMAVTRVHLNQVVAGDKIGIALHDNMKQMVYLLLCNIDELCSIYSPTTDTEGRSSIIPAINVQTEFVFRVDAEGNNTLVSLSEDNDYDNEVMTPFVQHLMNAVYDIPKAFPWKPHFLPKMPQSLKRSVIEARLVEDIAKATPVSYDDFEQMCRDAYNAAKNRKPTKTRRRPAARDRQQRDTRSQPELPILEVTTKGDVFYFLLDRADNPNGNVYSFTREDMGTKALTEVHLSNGDLDGIDIDESSKLMVLSQDVFGDKAYLRYFTINF